MKNWTFETLDPAYGAVTEGPAWDGSGLLFTRIQQSRIMRYDPVSGACAVFRENTNCANGLTFDAQGRLYGCEGGAAIDARRVVRYESDGSVTVLADRHFGEKTVIPVRFQFELSVLIVCFIAKIKLIRFLEIADDILRSVRAKHL